DPVPVQDRPIAGIGSGAGATVSGVDLHSFQPVMNLHGQFVIVGEAPFAALFIDGVEHQLVGDTHGIGQLGPVAVNFFVLGDVLGNGSVALVARIGHANGDSVLVHHSRLDGGVVKADENF